MSRMGTTVIPMDTAQTFSRQVAVEIRAAMASRGLSQRDVAEATLIPLVTLNRRLLGDGKAFTVSEIASIAELLGVSVTELMLRAERALTQRVAA